MRGGPQEAAGGPHPCWRGSAVFIQIHKSNNCSPDVFSDRRNDLDVDTLAQTLLSSTVASRCAIKNKWQVPFVVWEAFCADHKTFQKPVWRRALAESCQPHTLPVLKAHSDLCHPAHKLFTSLPSGTAYRYQDSELQAVRPGSSSFKSCANWLNHHLTVNTCGMCCSYSTLMLLICTTSPDLMHFAAQASHALFSDHLSLVKNKNKIIIHNIDLL